MKKLTKWLKKSEVYFTTICTILLSVMAIFVSIISNQVANRQFEIEYFEKMPDFQITKQQLLNRKNQKFEETQLIITKLSGKAKNIEVDTFTLLEVEYSNTNSETKKSSFLIEGFYNISYLSGKTEGLIQTETGDKNNSREIELESYIEDMITDQNKFLSTKLSTYVQIKYLNFENKLKTEYFDASSISGKLINNDTLGKYFDPKSKYFNSKNTINLNRIEEKEKLNKIISTIK